MVFCDDATIANAFCDSFSSVQFDSYANSGQVADCLNSVQLLLQTESIKGNADGFSLFNVSDVENGLSSLKFGKAGSLDGLTKESIAYCHPVILIHLQLLFNMICLHGYVPDDFGVGVIVPIVKDRFGDICKTDNYRPITLSPVISKIFEYCILHKYDHFLCSDSLQFGFKKQSGCSHALFVLSQVADYFNSHGSSVYVASLDASKAFDRVNHVKLFNKLLEKGLPGNIIKILIDWYGKIFGVVKWNDAFSTKVSVRSGIRQGGILSPFLFNIYVDSLIMTLKSSDLGCHVSGVYLGCIAYADDFLLLSASVTHLQKMLDMCCEHAKDIDIEFNPKKCCLLKIGKHCRTNIGNLNMNGCDIVWMDKIKYLGVYLTSSRSMTIDVSLVVRKFYAAANAILGRSKNVHEITRLCLLESYTLPILTYGCEGLDMSTTSLNKLNVCWNSVYRKIFGMHRWESVKIIQLYCERLDLIRIVHLRQLKFYSALRNSPNDVVAICFQWLKHSSKFKAFCNGYEFDINYCKLCCSNVFERFRTICTL